MPWTPSGVVVEDWAKALQLVVGGVDVTFYRGIPAEIQAWDETEPFGPLSLVVGFPQITSFESLPSWLRDYADVELRRVRPDDSTELLWTGLFIEEDLVASPTGGVTVTSLGSLYQADLHRMLPEVVRWPRETGHTDLNYVVARELDPGRRPQLRLLPTIVPGTAGVQWQEQGSGQPLLTGYIGDALAIGTNSGLPAPGEGVVGFTGLPDGSGYFLTGTAGSVLVFGGARYQGSILGVALNEPGSRLALNSTGTGYWIAARDGGVFAFNAGFFGSLGGAGNPNDVIAMEATADDQGYWLADTIGGVFAFGSAGFHGSLLAPGAPDLVAGDSIVDLARSHAGAGYLLLSRAGRVYAFGDAVYSGGGEATGKTFVALARRQAGGYWLLASDGTVYGYGGASTNVFTPNPAPVSQPAVDIYGTSSGAGYWVAAADGGVFAYGDATFHGSVPGGGGVSTQWTLHLDAPRRPVMRVKDVWTVHWTVRPEQPGVEIRVKRDLKDAPNRFFGEGVDPDGCRWRNTRFPGVRPDPAPVFAGTELVVGSTAADVAKWEREMSERWSAAIEVDGVFSQADSNEARRFQRQAGLVQTGTVNASTWAAAFAVGSNGSDLDAAHLAPLDQDPATERWLYNAMGGRIGSNPAFDSSVVAVETYENYGARVHKWEGIVSAAARRRRERAMPWHGAITFTADPPEGSRFAIRAGQNVKVQGLRGADVVLHIARRRVDWATGTVTVDVDQGGRDYLTLAAMRQRLRDSTSPTKQRSYRNSVARAIPDAKAAFDCEAGAGIIPRHAIAAGQWNVLRVPAASAGTLKGAEFFTDNTTTAKLSVGVFDRVQVPASLAARGGTPLDEGWWDTFDDNWGLLINWGQFEQAGGYYPGRESDGDPITGETRDQAQWWFESTRPPWLWVALWCSASTFVRGRIFIEAE